MYTTQKTIKQLLIASWPLNGNVWLHRDSLQQPNWDLLNKKYKYSMHRITLRKRKKMKTVVVLKHTLRPQRWSRFTLTSLWVMFSMSTPYFKLNFWPFSVSPCSCRLNDTCSNKEKTLSFPIKRGLNPLYPLLLRIHGNSHSPDMLLHIYFSKKLPADSGCYMKRTD